MGRFLGNVLEGAPKRPARVRAAACELRTEDGSVLVSGDYVKCANEVVKRCRVLFKGTGQLSTGYGRTSVKDGTNASTFRWTIVGPDGAVRTRHAITVLS